MALNCFTDYKLLKKKQNVFQEKITDSELWRSFFLNFLT